VKHLATLNSVKDIHVKTANGSMVFLTPAVETVLNPLFAAMVAVKPEKLVSIVKQIVLPVLQIGVKDPATEMVVPIQVQTVHPQVQLSARALFMDVIQTVLLFIQPAIHSPKIIGALAFKMIVMQVMELIPWSLSVTEVLGVIHTVTVMVDQIA